MAYDKAFPVAKECADKFLNGTGGELWDKMTPEMQQHWAMTGRSGK